MSYWIQVVDVWGCWLLNGMALDYWILEKVAIGLLQENTGCSEGCRIYCKLVLVKVVALSY